MRLLFFLTLFTVLILPVFAVSELDPVCGDGLVNGYESRLDCCMDVDCGYRMSCDFDSNFCVFDDSIKEYVQDTLLITGYSVTPIREEFKAAYFMFLGVMILAVIFSYNFFLKKNM